MSASRQIENDELPLGMLDGRSDMEIDAEQRRIMWTIRHEWAWFQEGMNRYVLRWTFNDMEKRRRMNEKEDIAQQPTRPDSRSRPLGRNGGRMRMFRAWGEGADNE